MVNISYFTREKQKDPEAPKISKYALGSDYHRVIREKLEKLGSLIASLSKEVETRIFVDTSPVMEKAMAARAGLGWTGKHSVMLSRQHGSFFFLGGIMTNLELVFDRPVKDACGNCTICIDACPTKAIIAPYILDARKCISGITIGYKGETIPEEFRDRMSGYVFGCDICQDVCPWNIRFATGHAPEFSPRKELLSLTRDEWYAMDESRFNELFEDSAVKHYKFSAIRRNLEFISGS